MSNEVILNGITWNHSRGFVPMVATAQRFSEMHPGITINWRKRSLQQFADQPIEALANEYDLLVIDHPWIGFAAERNIFLSLEKHLPEKYLNELAANSAGASYKSYWYNNQLWALPVDAAAPVASYRPDIIRDKGLSLPRTFDELLSLADKGLVIFPAIPIDSLMHFYMFCCTLGEAPFLTKEEVISEVPGIKALQLLKDLASRVDKICFDCNPIKVYELMTQTDQFAYCPFAYGYINYAQKAYAEKLLQFDDMPALNGQSFISTIGGTGIAISAKSKNKEVALAYAQYVASGECQQNLYVNTGGQPAHLKAWKNDDINGRCLNFLKATLPALQRSFLRPRYPAYIDFQDHGGDVVRDYIMGYGEAESALQKLNELYCKTK